MKSLYLVLNVVYVYIKAEKNNAYAYIFIISPRMYTSACVCCTVQHKNGTLAGCKHILVSRGKNVVLVKYHVGRCFVGVTLRKEQCGKTSAVHFLHHFILK